MTRDDEYGKFINVKKSYRYSTTAKDTLYNFLYYKKLHKLILLCSLICLHQIKRYYL